MKLDFAVHISPLVSVVQARVQLTWCVGWEAGLWFQHGDMSLQIPGGDHAVGTAWDFWRGTSQHTATVSVLHIPPFTTQPRFAQHPAAVGAE